MFSRKGLSLQLCNYYEINDGQLEHLLVYAWNASMLRFILFFAEIFAPCNIYLCIRYH